MLYLITNYRLNKQLYKLMAKRLHERDAALECTYLYYYLFVCCTADNTQDLTYLFIKD